MVHPVRLVLVTVFLLAATIGSAAIQQQSSTQQPTFRTRIDAVTVDVIATDRTGHHVTDLTAADFEITENGKSQKIDSFRRITLDDRYDPDRVNVPITSLDVQQREAARDDVRLLVIFLDDYHTRRENALAIREKLAKFIAGLDSRDMVAVMYPLTPTLALTFSRDHEGTAGAVRKFAGRKYDYVPRYPEEDIYVRLSPQQIEDLRNEIVIGAVEGLSVALGSLRDGRQSVLMVSEGLQSLLPPQIASRGRISSLPTGAPNLFSTRQQSQRSLDLLMRMRDIFKAANRSNTSVYTWDPRGLAPSEFDLSDPAVDFSSDSRVLRESIESLRTIADQTGGRAIVNTNDPGPLLQQMLTDTSAYYLLGYTSTEAPRDGRFHEINVTVKRKGVDLRSRRGYWAYSSEDFARASTPSRPNLSKELADALSLAASSSSGHALHTWVGFDRSDAGGQSAVTLVWEFASQVPASETPDRVTIVANAGQNDVLYKGRSTRDPQSPRPSGRVSFTARPGALHVRVSAEGTTGQFLDSEERDFIVPDFTTVGPIVTTPAAFRARTARELAQIQASSTALPVTVQQFSRTDQLLLRFRAYGPAGTTPAGSLRLRSSGGETLSTLPLPERRADSAYDVPIPLSGLAPGSYLVEIEATSGDDTSRAIWGFRITG